MFVEKNDFVFGRQTIYNGGLRNGSYVVSSREQSVSKWRYQRERYPAKFIWGEYECFE